MLGYEDCRVGKRREKGQRRDEFMQVNWINEQEKEENYKASTVVIFDSHR